MNAGDLLLLYIDSDEPQLFIRWQLVELIRKRVLGFSLEGEVITISRSKNRNIDNISNDLEQRLDQEVGDQSIELFTLLNTIKRLNFTNILELTKCNHYSKRTFADKLKSRWILTSPNSELKSKLDSKLEQFAINSRKRNPNIDELLSEALLIHENIIEFTVVLWTLTSFNAYKTILSELNSRFIENSMNIENADPIQVASVLDFVIYGTPQQEKISLGLENFIMTEINGY